MKRISEKYRYAVTAVVLLMWSAFPVLAQDFDAGSKITSMTSQIKTIGHNIVGLASVLIGVVGAIMLVWNYFKRAKGEGQGNDALASWGWGLIFTFIGLQIIARILLT